MTNEKSKTEQFEELILKIPPELRNTVFISALTDLELHKLMKDTPNAKKELKEKVHSLVDELELDNLFAVYPLLMSIANLNKRRVELRRVNSINKSKADFYEEGYQKGLEKGSKLRIKELKKMRE